MDGSMVFCLLVCLSLLPVCWAQTPTAVGYINRISVSDLDLLLDATSGYTHLLFAFWTAARGPVDAARLWVVNNLARDPRVQAARRRGVKFIISCGGATETPQFTVPGTEYGRRAAEFASQNGFDGVDFDIEGFQPGNDGKGTKWLVDATREAKRIFPNSILSHAPQAPYFTAVFSSNYLDVHGQVGDLIDFYNIQFYNQGSTQYDTYQTLFEVSDGWSTGTAVRQILGKGIPLSQIVVGKPITKAGAANTGFVPMDQLAGIFRTAKSRGILPRGFMGWQWILDAEELGGRWTKVLAAVWAVSSEPNVPGVENPCTITYTVQEGDSLSSIAERYGTTWQAIFELNKDTVSDPDLIFPDQELRIPSCVT